MLLTSKFMNAIHFNNEDYAQIKQDHLSRGILYSDENFKCELDNVNCLAGDNPVTMKFKRITEISKNPVLKQDGPPGIICLGTLGNMNIVLAMSVVSENQNLWEAIFPDWKMQNVFEKANGYAGIFKVRFWIDGAYTEIIVDDLLPTVNDKLVCPYSSNKNEFWPSILVKSYAKLLGGYACLEQVRLEDALQDLTGGVLDTLSFAQLTEANALRQVNLFETLTMALSENALVLLCTKSTNSECKENCEFNGNSCDNASERDAFDQLCAPRRLGSINNETGLCSNYTYLLTKTCLMPWDPTIMGTLVSVFKRAVDNPPKDRLLRLRSVLTVSGKTTTFGEWKGPYSDNSKEWEELTVDQRTRVGLVLSTESEFWMPLHAMLEQCAGAVVCRLPKTGLFNSWTLSDYHGEWHGVQSGGGLDFRETFLNNPQYTFELTKDIREEVLISLTRKHIWDSEANAIVCDSTPVGIGFGLLKVETNRQVRVHVLSQCKIVDVHEVKSHRAIFGRYSLERGRYVLIPFTEEPLQEACYYLRLYLPRQVENKELTLDQPAPGLFSFFSGSPVMATRVEIRRANNLAWLNPKIPPMPYCKVSCEDTTVYTSTKVSTSNPVWNEIFVFYRNRPEKRPIVIEIFDKRKLGTDGFLGEHILGPSVANRVGDFDVDLFCKSTKKEVGARMKGILAISLYSVNSDNFCRI